MIRQLYTWLNDVISGGTKIIIFPINYYIHVRGKFKTGSPMRVDPTLHLGPSGQPDFLAAEAAGKPQATTAPILQPGH